MASFNKFQQTVQNLGDGQLDLNADSLYLILITSATAPAATDTKYDSTHGPPAWLQASGATEIAAGNGYTAGGTICGSTAYSQSGGTGTLTSNSVVWTASGGSMAAFEYVVCVDESALTSATRPLIGWWSYGSALTLASGETFTVTFASGILTLA